MVNILNAQELMEGIKDYEHLLGDFEVTVLLPATDGEWREGGKGEASFIPTLGGRFIEENISASFGEGSLNMKNTIGLDPREGGKLRLVAMDKEYGAMDMYRGKKDGQKLIFDNLTSDARFENQNGQNLAFQLTFDMITHDLHTLLVEFTDDDGKSWKPYTKIEYRRTMHKKKRQSKRTKQ